MMQAEVMLTITEPKASGNAGEPLLETTHAEQKIEDDADAATAVEPEGFAVVDEDSANWVVRKVAEARSYRDRVAAWAASETRRSEHEERFLLDRYGGQLRDWTKQEIGRRGGRRKTVRLPGGEVGFRAEPARLLIRDDGEILAWCRRNLLNALKVSVQADGQSGASLEAWASQHAGSSGSSNLVLTQTVSKSVLNSHVAESGELPDGCEFIPAGERFFLR